MSDSIYLLVDGKRLEHFTSYEIDADIYAGAAAFTLELARPEVRITTGLECQLYVNDQLELTGIIDKLAPRYDKNGRTLTITGRDLMGWLVDAHAENFITLKDYKVKTLAKLLLRKAPKEFFTLLKVEYDENIQGRLKAKGSNVAVFDTTTPRSQIEPGMSIFDVLSQYAKSKGFLFYALPKGTFVFGRPKDAGTSLFTLVNRKDGRGNNIVAGEKTDDITKRYSKITVVGQKQGTGTFRPTDINVEGTPLVDPDFPFYKPFILKDEYGGDRPDLQARLAMEKMKHDGFRLNYTVQGHSQGGKNWCINELATVRDDDPYFELYDDYLLYGRTFLKTKDRGTITKLRLGLPGMRA